MALFVSLYSRFVCSPLFLSLALTVHARSTPYFDRTACMYDVLKLQNTTGFSKNTPEFFAYDPVSQTLLNGEVNLTLTHRGCEEFCGPPSLYWDAVPRIVTWVIPVFLLLSNIELSPIDKKRFMTIVHALGDPIDSFWSIIHKIYVWNRLYEIGLQTIPASAEDLAVQNLPLRFKLRRAWLSVMAAFGIVRLQFREHAPEPTKDLGSKADEERATDPQQTRTMGRDYKARIIATVLSGFEELSGSRIKTDMYYHMIIHRCGGFSEEGEEASKFEEWRKCARVLADARTNEYMRACLAIAVYFLDLIAAFIPSVGGGSSSPPGGRIGSAIFISWLIPLALLSNRVGTFTSRRVCLQTMKEFIAATIGPNEVGREESPSESTRRASDGTGVSPTQTSAPAEHGCSYDRQGPIDDAAQWARDLEFRMFSQTQATGDFADLRVVGGDLDSSSGTGFPWKRFGVSSESNSRRPLLESRETGYGPASSVEEDMGRINLPPVKPKGCLRLDTETTLIGNEDSRTRVSLIRFDTWDEYFSSLQWLGAIYTYRPWKLQYQHVDHRTHAKGTNGMMALAGLFPVSLSAVSASAIIWYAVPEGFSCRNVWVVVFFFLWIVSAAVTTGAYVWVDRRVSKEQEEEDECAAGSAPLRDRRRRRRHGNLECRLWRWIVLKDAVIAVSCGVTVFLSTAGIFNNCWCWSIYMTKHEAAVIPMNTNRTYEERAVRLFSVVVISCIGLQVLFFLAIAWWWRRGLSLARWHEADRLREWAQETGYEVQWSPRNRLIFWYYKSELDAEESRRERRATDYEMHREPSYFERSLRRSLPWIYERKSSMATRKMT
ncbi:hypothetical protein DL770_004087 [Monosporascus sp. CRB-9-2]|nr:hypothetical protein DL770_004087 [Monosporascus sp. CRB-9-2]